MEDNQEKILGFIRGKGPVLPVEVAKHIDSNILMASAHLSELSSNGKVKISNVKVGGSPLYYISGQEAQLQKFADNLHEKEKRAYDLLFQKKVLNDTEAEPVIRVALRAIKDYAVPLQVNFKGDTKIFWRWYLLSNKEAEELIRPFFKEQKEVKKTEKKPIEKEQEKIEKPIEKKKPIKKEKIDKNVFLDLIISYFNKNKVNILSKEAVRKSEIDFIVQVPSAVGDLEYYCKAKNKKKISDNDLASAFVQGQLRKLPVLFLTNGELTKRANEMLQKDFKGMGVMKV